MAKSRIIRELANGEISIGVALKRAKVLLSAFNNEDLIKWVNCELTGYANESPLPDYRLTTGNLFGSYIEGVPASHIKYTNVPLSLGVLSEDVKKAILSIQFTDGAEALQLLLKQSSKDTPIAKSIPADFYPIIAKGNKDPFMCISSAQVICAGQKVQDVISAIESKLLDILCLLEKEFGILDDLDIDTTSKSDDDVKRILEHISFIIYNDNRITIGDDNQIENSQIASSINE